MKKSPRAKSKQHLSPRFRFEPGSYGGVGSFMSSIANLKQIAPNKWDYHFVLVKPDVQYRQEDTAVSEAERDLDMAFRLKQQSGSDHVVAEYLRAQGYVSVTNFNIVKGPKSNRQ
ncbi:MAG: hypothetical protein AB1510_11550 [Bacillota bacterium]